MCAFLTIWSVQEVFFIGAGATVSLFAGCARRLLRVHTAPWSVVSGSYFSWYVSLVLYWPKAEGELHSHQNIICGKCLLFVILFFFPSLREGNRRCVVFCNFRVPFSYPFIDTRRLFGWSLPSKQQLWSLILHFLPVWFCSRGHSCQDFLFSVINPWGKLAWY